MNTHKLRPRRLVVLAGSGLAALIVASGGASAAGMCKNVRGTFTLQSVTGPACGSSVGICATGQYRGAIAGNSTFTGSSVVATADTAATGVVLVTGDNTIDSGRGMLKTRDALLLKTTGEGDFAEVDTIVGGTMSWAGATGQLRAQGTFTPATGGGGSYTGEVCAP